MFKKKLIDTVEEMDQEYLRSPTLFDPFRNVPVSTKKPIAAATNKRLQAAMFEDNEEFQPREVVDHKFDYSLDGNESRSDVKATPPKQNIHSVHPLEEPLMTLSNSLMQFCTSLNTNNRCSVCCARENFSFQNTPQKEDSSISFDVKDVSTMRDAQHPFELFGKNVRPKLDDKDAKRYEAAFIDARRNRALAYYFFQNDANIKRQSKLQIECAFRKYLNSMKKVSIENIKKYIIVLKNNSNYKPMYINRLLKSIKYVVEFSYKFDEDFPPLPPVDDDNTPDVVLVTEHDILKAHRVLMRMMDFENALLLQLMFVLHLMPFEIRWLRFDDVTTTKDGKHMIRYKHTKAAKAKKVMLSTNIYEEIQNYKHLIEGDSKKYYLGQRSLSNGKLIRGFFIFNVRTETISDRLRTGFSNKLPWFSCTSYDVVKALDVN